MNLKNASRVLGALASVVLMSGVASAATVGAGTFNLAGTVYVTNTSLLFGLAQPTGSSADETAAVVNPVTGAFSGLTALSPQTIHNLLTPGNGGTFGPGPVIPGTSFTLAPFISLSNGIELDLTGANPLPIGPNSVCTGTSADNAPGNVCTAQPGSPITLEQGTTTVTAILSMTGLAHFTGDSTTTPFVGKFSASFSQGPDATISGLLADLATNGFITTGYQASFTTIPSPVVPEPASMALIGAGLFALGLFGKKKFAK